MSSVLPPYVELLALRWRRQLVAPTRVETDALRRVERGELGSGQQALVVVDEVEDAHEALGSDSGFGGSGSVDCGGAE